MLPHFLFLNIMIVVNKKNLLRLKCIADITFPKKKKKNLYESSKEIQTLSLDYFDLTASQERQLPNQGQQEKHK